MGNEDKQSARAPFVSPGPVRDASSRAVLYCAVACRAVLRWAALGCAAL